MELGVPEGVVVDSEYNEIESIRKSARDWKETAEVLAIELGDIKYAQEAYWDIQDGLYAKVRERIKSIE